MPDKPVSAPLPPIPLFPSFVKNISTRTSLYTPLYNAAMKGHWESAEKFLRSHPGAINVRITKGMDTVLHIAAGAKHTNFVEEVVKMMSPADLALRNKSNNTALCYAAASGVAKIAETMVNKNRDLPGMRGNKGATPLYIAALFGHRDMVSYLFKVTDDEHLTEEDYLTLLLATINTDLFDLALTILWKKPELATLRDHDGMTALHILAQKPSAFASTSSLESWQRILYPLICVEEKYNVGFPSGLVMSDIRQTNQVSLYLLEKLWCAVELIVPGIKAVHEKKTMHMQVLQLVKLLCEQVSSLEDSKIADLLMHPSQPLLIAAGFGIVELVTELVRSHPDLLWKVDEQSRNIFHVAVMYRREKIFGLIHDLGVHKDMITAYKDPDNNHNLLHLAGKLAPLDQLNSVSGAALQMQRELLWFKEVEKTVHPLSKQMRDKNGQTPRMLFTEEHRALVKEGEDWMKSTASSCMLVSTLITTVMFAAIFTVPGGTNKGLPILLGSNSFTTFAISDAFALFSSVTSILMFLSILTSRYAEEDFLESLPKRLIIGLTTLFLSIASMLVAFSATFFIALGCRLAWILVPIALASCVPITLFAFLHFPLLADMLRSSYGTGLFTREATITLC